ANRHAFGFSSLALQRL
ncbi:hypothetical protein D030_1856B, partial [Vibrio parahaemolyticus AQ3810]